MGVNPRVCLFALLFAVLVLVDSSFAIRKAPKKPKYNSKECDLPDEYNSKAHMAGELYAESIIKEGIREANIRVHINIDQNEGAPNWFHAVDLSGIVIQYWNTTLTTYAGRFYMYTPALTLVAEYFYNLFGTQKEHVPHSYCLHFPNITGVNQPREYVSGRVVTENMVENSYEETVEMGGVLPGRTSRMEWFWDSNGTTINCITDFDTTGLARATVQVCLGFTPTTSTVSVASVSNLAKRDLTGSPVATVRLGAFNYPVNAFNSTVLALFDRFAPSTKN